MQVNRPNGRGHVPHPKQEHETNSELENQLPNPQDFTQNSQAPKKFKDIRGSMPNLNHPTNSKAIDFAYTVFNNPVLALRTGISVFGQYISSAGKSIGGSLVAGGLKLVEMAVFSLDEIKITRQQNLLKLKNLTGDENIGQFFEYISAYTSGLMISTIEKDFFCAGVQNETRFLQSLIECMITKMAVNIAEKLRSQGQEASLLTIGAQIVALMQEQIVNVQQKIKEAESIANPTDKEAAINHVATEAATAILSLIFPKGEEELPLRDALKSFSWTYLKETLLPNTIFNAAVMANGLQDLSGLRRKGLTPAEMTPEKKKMISMAEVSKEIENVITILGPKLVADQEISKSLARILLEQIGVPKGNQEANFASWLTKQIQQINNTNDPSILALWNFLGSSVESTIFFLLDHIGKNGNEENWQETIADTLLREIGEFDKKYRSEVEQIYRMQLQKEVEPEKICESVEYIQCFIPLAKSFEEIGGLTELKFILSPKTYEQINLWLAKILASKYELYLKPLATAYRSFENPLDIRQSKAFDSLSNGEQTLQQIEETAEIVAGQFSKYLITNQEKKVKKITDKIIENLPTIEEVRDLLKEGEVILPEQKILGTALIGKDSSLSVWLYGQVEKLLARLGDNSQLEKSLFWKVFNNSLAAALEHIVIFKKMQPFEAGAENIPEMVMKEFTESMVTFGKQYGVEVQKHYDELIAAGLKPYENRTFIKRFKPLCQDLLNRFGVKNEGGGVLETALYRLILKYLPDQLAEYYQESLVIKASTEKATVKLEKIFRTEHLEKTPEIITQIENICYLLSEKLGETITELVYDSVIEIVVEEKQKNSEKEIKKLTEETKKIIRPQLISVHYPRIQKQAYSLIMQGLSNYLEKFTLGGIAIDADSPIKILKEIGKTLKIRLKEDANAIKEAARIQDPKQKKLALREAFKPLTHALVEIVSPLSSVDASKIPLEIPFGDLLEENWQEAKAEIIPDVLGKLYTSSTTWVSESEKSRQILKQETGKSFAAEACRILADWTCNFIPVSLIRDKEELTDGIYDAAVKHLIKNGNHEGLSVKEFLQQNEILIKKHVCEDVFSLIAPDSPLIASTKPLTKEFIESAYLKIFSNLTAKINENQGPKKEQETFMVNLGINLLGAANKHFNVLLHAMEQENKSEAYEVPHEKYVKYFQEERVLNLGTPQTIIGMEKYHLMKQLSEELTKERRIMLRSGSKANLPKIIALKKELREAKKILSRERQKFFVPLANTYMQLSGITSPEQIPCPLSLDSPLRKELFNKFRNELLPKVLESIFEEIMDPRARAKMALSGLKTLNDALDKMPDVNEEDLTKDDDAQRELNRVCGELVLQLVQLVPKSMIKAAFKIERVQELSAEMVGKAVRNYLAKDLDIITLINQGIEEGMDSLHPGEWVGVEGEKNFVGATKNGQLNFLFPITDEEEELKIQAEMVKADQEIRELRRAMVKITRRVMGESFSAVLVAPLIKLKKIWDECIAQVFGKYAPDVHHLFELTGFKLIYRILEGLSSFFSYPFREVFWFFMEIHIGRKADLVIKSMQLDIHENLLYQLMDAFTASLEQKTTLIPIGEILNAADQWDMEEKNEVIEFIQKFGLTMKDIFERRFKKVGLPESNSSRV